MITLLLRLSLLLEEVVEFFKRRGAVEDASKAQTDRDNLEKDPGSWFTRHFGGLRNDATRSDTTDKTDAPPGS